MAAAVFEHHVGPFLLRDCGHFVPWEAPHALVSGVRMMRRTCSRHAVLAPCQGLDFAGARVQARSTKQLPEALGLRPVWRRYDPWSQA